ncbi:hypothetical protein [Pseudonocardia spirodelae]|uniref:Transporter n=1 Tax=Pseudonocardia spirodelae TaxID=3133431 RepID=A0ABU8T5E4_9PSEU
MIDRRSTDLDEQPPSSPAEALAIVEREQARHAPDLAPFFVLWGLAWVAIGLAWFGSGSGLWSAAVAGIVTAVAVAGGMVVSAVLGSRIDRGVSGPSRTAGARLGVGWVVAMAATGAVAVGVVRLTEPGSAVVAALFPTLFVLVVGVIYMMTGALWRSRPDFGLGIALQVVAVATVFTPLPWNNLVMAVGGGGSLVVAGLLRRGRR